MMGNNACMKPNWIIFATLTLMMSTGTTAATEIPDEVSYQIKPQFGDLGEIADRGILRILVTHSQTDFFFDQGQIRGIQYDMAMAYMKTLNEGRTNRLHASEANRIFPQFVPVPFNQLIPALLAGRGDIAAAFLTQTSDRENVVTIISPQARSIDEILVKHRNASDVKRLADLSGKKIYVMRDSSYVEHLRLLNDQLVIADLPPVEIMQADSQLLTEDILEMVNSGVIQYTISDDYKAELWAQVLENIVLLPDIRIFKDAHMGWAIRPDSPELSASLAVFSADMKQGTYMGNLLFRRYLDNTQWIDNPLSQHEREKLLTLVDLFVQYGNRFNFDPLAIAAQSFQESRLDNSRRSHRGAVGIMQLLPSTARDPNVNIPNIELLENNIHAGTKYLRFLQDRYFSEEDIDPVNQWLFSWAAYNAGPANIIRVRQAAADNGLNPNIWFGHVEHMAAKMISREPVRYVASIYKYYTAYLLARGSQTGDSTEALKAVFMKDS